jgi:hypothetical protein
MAFKKKSLQGLVATDPVTLGTIALGATYARVHGFIARNYADATMAAAGTDAAIKVKLTDANSDVFFLDAADRDYKTAEVTLALAGADDTTTGLGVTTVDATGAAAAAGEGVGAPIVQSPVTVVLSNGVTATDYFKIALLVEV